MTEKEARNKWCPMSNFIDDYKDRTNGNRNLLPRDEGKCDCVASKCSVWRWILKTAPSQGEIIARIIKSTDGYCGLGGKP